MRVDYKNVDDELRNEIMSNKNIIQAVWKQSEKGEGLDKNQAEEEEGGKHKSLGRNESSSVGNSLHWAIKRVYSSRHNACEEVAKFSI